MLCDSSGVVWIGRRNGAVSRMVEGVSIECDAHEGIGGYSISDLSEDDTGRIWFAARHSGEYGYFDRDGSVTILRPPSGPPQVACLTSSGRDSMFLGVQRFAEWDGVWEYTNDGRVQRVAGTQGTSANAILADSQGRLWVGTSEGVLVLDNDFVVTYNMSDGLPSDLVISLYEDSRGVIWVGTEGGGAACFDGQVFQVIRMVGDMPLNSVSAIAEAKGGVMWFATNGGLVRYQRKEVIPAAVLTLVSADRDYRPRDGLQVPDTAGRLSVSFQGRSSSVASSELVYRYRLSGLAEAWHQTAELEAEFTKLRPRSYTFELQVVDPDLNYSDVVAIDFEVTEDPKIGALTAALSDDRQGEFIGSSTSLEEVRRQVREVGWTDLTVLILGETGTGKGLAARAVHEDSERRNGPFIHVNCGALPSGLVDSELFGHERGAFTGAVARKLGKFELAEGGSIFLDEIGDLPPDSQTRLLRVLQDRCIERVGGATTISTDVRVIAATNRDLSGAVKRSEYRADLFYRLNVFPITIPPLRARTDDIVDLAIHFASVFAAHLSVSEPQISERAREALLAYAWPGNVRELEHTVQRAVLLSRGRVVDESHLGLAGQSEEVEHTESTILPLAEYERLYIERVLETTGGVIHGDSGAAKLLGLKPTTLRSRMAKLGVRRP
jgi:DNA-binding NtrC family response regulator